MVTLISKDSDMTDQSILPTDQYENIRLAASKLRITMALDVATRKQLQKNHTGIF